MSINVKSLNSKVKNLKKIRKKLLKADHSKLFIRVGLALVVVALTGFLIIFYPSIAQELKYLLNKPESDAEISLSFIISPTKKKVIFPVDKEFGIIIPKIGANAKVIADVDPFDPGVYQVALTQGVAHARDSAYPGEEGNTFLFAHSSDNFYNANRYNSVFYLLKKLETGDVFYLVYSGEIYKYKVTETKLIEAEEVEYLTKSYMRGGYKTAVLMTCWPPGTTLKRWIVIGELEEEIAEESNLSRLLLLRDM
jgi:LPXTG-site transpeptidase (sortase) family protein